MLTQFRNHLSPCHISPSHGLIRRNPIFEIYPRGCRPCLGSHYQHLPYLHSMRSTSHSSHLTQTKGQRRLSVSTSCIRISCLNSMLHHHSGILHGTIAALFVLESRLSGDPFPGRMIFVCLRVGSIVQPKAITLLNLSHETKRNDFRKPLNRGTGSKMAPFSSWYHPMVIGIGVKFPFLSYRASANECQLESSNHEEPKR